jgi:hypothetical protein
MLLDERRRPRRRVDSDFFGWFVDSLFELFLIYS